MKKLVICIGVFTLFFSKINAQTVDGGITTATPFLLIVPDARAGAMGDIGVSTSADANSLFHNPAKIAFGARQIYAGIN